MSKRVYIVDDDPAIRRSLISLLLDEGYEANAYPDTSGLANSISKDSSGVLLLDIALPGEDGMTFLRRCRKEYPLLGIIMITGEASIDRAVAATKLGAIDFLEKPLNPPRLLVSVRNVLKQQQLYRKVAETERSEEQRYRLIGAGAAMRRLQEAIDRVAASDSTVLILGENGTGKELVAYQIWARSSRRDAPYIKVNCAAIPSELSEAELFGFRRGAFTGANRDREGKFKAADGGTLLLDEIGDLSEAVQAKLLRVLETGELEPLGSEEPQRVNVRLLAATNKDLQARVASGDFRQDLFYRLNVVPIEVPPLRERREDISALTEHFARRLADSTGLGQRLFSPQALGYLSGLDYRGNVRELRNIVERCYILARTNTIDVAELKAILGGEPETDISEVDNSKNLLTSAVRNFERSFLSNELAKAKGNISELARSLGMDRGNLSRKLKGYGLV